MKLRVVVRGATYPVRASPPVRPAAASTSAAAVAGSTYPVESAPAASVSGNHGAGEVSSASASDATPECVTAATLGRFTASAERCGLVATQDPVRTRTATFPTAVALCAACSSAARVCEHTSIVASHVALPKSVNASPAHVSHCASVHAHVTPLASLGQSSPFTVATVPPPLAAVSVCLLYTSPSPRDATLSRMPSSA